MTGTLYGLRILDLSHILAGPFCTMILGDMGAEVIKIEPPGGDGARTYGPFIKDESAYFMSINRNKKSVVVNIKTVIGVNIVKRLSRISDVIVENFRPGTLEKLGLGYEEIRKENPRIIYASISGFGHTGPYKDKPSYDMVVQGTSGLMSITGEPNGQPVRVGISIGDLIAGHHAAIGILGALYYKEKTGLGQRLDYGMLDGMVYLLENAITRYYIEGVVPEPLGTSHPSITPFQAFKTKDNYIILPLGSEKLWLEFCQVIGREDLTKNLLFSNNYQRTLNKHILIPELEKVFQKKTYKEWSNIFEKNGIPYGPINTIKEVVKDQQVISRQMIVEMEHSLVGPYKTVGSPFKLSQTQTGPRMPAPYLGQHTREALSNLLGFDDEYLSELKEKGVVGWKDL